jgi:uncharacterized protein DUF4325
MTVISMFPLVGNFAENKDMASRIRIEKVIPAIEMQEEVTLDFQGIDSATQSFIHALISELIRKFGIEVLDLIEFKNCNDVVKQIICIVVDYMQEGG